VKDIYNPRLPGNIIFPQYIEKNEEILKTYGPG
jgi:hypothetical protein